MIADEHDLALDREDGVDELGDLAGRDHARLVDDEHAPLRHRCPRVRRSASSANVLVLWIPAPSWSSAAARRAVATPSTGWPADCQASRAAASANVLPVPGLPASTATPSPSRQSRSTAVRCSPVIVGRVRSAPTTPRSLATPASPRRAARTRSISSCSSSDMRARGVAQLLPVDRQHPPVTTTERLTVTRRVSDQGDHVLGCEEAVGRRLQRRAIDAGAGRQLLADGLEDVVARERRLAPREADGADEPLEQAIPLARAWLLRAGTSGDQREFVAAEAELRRPGPPLAGQLPRAVAGSFGRRVASAAASAARAPDVPRCSSAASISARRRLNPTSTRRRTPTTSAIPLRTGDHSTPTLRVSSAAQHRLVDEARRARVRVQPPAIQRRPAPIAAAAEVGDQHVRMQLRIPRPRRPMPKRRRHKPRRLLHQRPAMAAPDRRRRPLQIGHRRPRRHVMRRPHPPPQLLVADAEQDAHRLRRRERQIKPAHPDRARGGPQRRPVRRVQAGQHRRSASPSTGPVQPELAARGADPLAARLRPAGVVVLDPVADAVDHVHPALGPGRGSTSPGRPRAFRSTTRTRPRPLSRREPRSGNRVPKDS